MALPRFYVCPRCKSRYQYSEKAAWAAPVTKDKKPFCPDCFIEAIGRMVPLMKPETETAQNK